MKKIVIVICSVLLAFTTVFAIQQNQADAFASKLLGMSAKKMAKEVAKDIAIESAANFALNEAFKIADAQLGKYSAVEEAYKIVCLHETATGDCDKPVSIKENLSEADKTAIGHQAEIELDKLVSVDGKGFTRWQKFLDWFAPIWITSAIMTVITYAFDSDVRTLFNDAGYNALVALGLIKPVQDTTQAKPIQSIVTETPPQTAENPLSKYQLSSGTGQVITVSGINIPNQNLGFQFYAHDVTSRLNSFSINLNGVRQFTHMLYSSFAVPTAIYGQGGTLTIANNGVVMETLQPDANNTTIDQTKFLPSETVKDLQTIYSDKLRSVRTRLPYFQDGFWYTDVLYFTTDGNTLNYQFKHLNFIKDATLTSAYVTPLYVTSTANKKVSFTITQNQSPYSSPYEPLGDETIDTMATSRYEKDEDIALIPPVAIPYTQTSTGKKLEIKPNPTVGGEPILTTPEGEIVPEEDVTLGDPVVTPSPDGTPQVTPEPTASNPNPEPIPLTPVPPTQPPTTEPPPPPEDGGGGKPNIPLSLLIGLFKLLFAIIFFLIRMFTFIVTIQMIPPVPIPNAAFQWFTTATFMGIKPYPLIINTATFFLGFSIYKSIRRVFP